MFIAQEIRTKNDANGNSRHATTVHWVTKNSTYLVDVLDDSGNETFIARSARLFDGELPTYYIAPSEWNRRIKPYMHGRNGNERLLVDVKMARLWRTLFNRAVQQDKRL